MNQIIAWFRRCLSDPQVIFLILSLLLFFIGIMTIGGILAPVLASVVIAYLLDGVVQFMERHGVPRLAAVMLVFLLFVAALIFVVLALVPMLVRQGTQLLQQLPHMIEDGQNMLMALADRYPNLLTEEQLQQFLDTGVSEARGWRQQMLSHTLSVGIGLLTFMVYLVIMPILVFFMLKDKHRLIAWFQQYLPDSHGLTAQVWRDVDFQVANYVRGKLLELILVWVVSFIVFAAIGLDYAVLLGAVVGFSVLVPYIGGAVAVIPIGIVALFQFGWSMPTLYALAAYGIIHFIDGNILVPVMFAGVLDLHPIAIIVAILFFGGIWGMWGVFFAIPLATLVRAVLEAWPRQPADVEPPPL